MTTRPALGRGLDALIPTTISSDGKASPDPLTLPLEKIQPNSSQPRTNINPAHLQELASSIRKHGILQPLLVTRQKNGSHVLVAGERRWRAAQLAGLTSAPVIITDFADDEMLTVALVENIQRQDLTPLEEAYAYQRLIDELQLTQEQVATEVGKGRTTIANSLRLLSLPTEIRMSLAAGEISAGHARAILGASGAKQQISLWHRVRNQDLTVRQTETAAKKYRLVTLKPTEKNESQTDIIAQERLQKALSTKVRVRRGRRGGTLVLSWYDDRQLEQIVNQIVDSTSQKLDQVPARIDI